MSSQGNTVVITGAASGIGRFVARTFAGVGANLVLADVLPMDTVLSEVRGLGAEAAGVTTDVTQERAVAALFDAGFRRFGRIDTLVNNAGIVTHFHVGAPRWPKFRDMPEEQFQRVIGTNLGGTFLCAKHAIPYMESLNAGHIVNFGQGNLKRSERRPNIGTAVYSTSKIAIRALTRDLADEERDFNICVLSMGPGGGGPSFERKEGPGVAGGGGGIITEDSPEWSRDPARSVDWVGDRYVLAADAAMDFSGAQVSVRDGALVVVDD